MNVKIFKIKAIPFILFFVFLILISLSSFGQVKLPRLIQDVMILQREAPVKIWGWASAGEKVELLFKGQTFEATTSNGGKWLITLPAQKAGGPFDIKITGSNQIILKDILFGDVWLCSGQSNMETTMSRVSPLYEKEIENCTNPNIRLFQVPVRWNFNAPQQDIQGGKWEVANPQNILKYTAVGYFFAHDIYEKYKIPVGIIQCAAGGSSAESWISEESLKTFPVQYKIAKELSDTTYMKNLLASERTSQHTWFNELGKSDLGRKSTPWHDQNLDDSSWPTFQLPSSFAEAEMDLKNGVVWFRKEIDLPKSCSGKQALLELGRIVDSDSVFINGKFVGTTGYQYPPRRYNVAAEILKEGKNNITVRVVSQSGNGAFIKNKPYQLTVDGQIFDLEGTWKYNIGAKCGPSPSATFFPGKPLGLYNAMLSPIVNYTLKGMVWYQGESNAERAYEYKTVLSTLIGEWRTLWGQGELPFLFVQLPDFMEAKSEPSESDWALLRYQQLKTLSVPNTAMAVTIGLGEWNDIHPLRKKEVGQRLALAAEKLAYNDKKVVASGPIYQSMKVKGTKIELTFSDYGSGLTTNDGKELKRFAIAGADGKFVWAKAKIEGEKVIVWNESIPNPLTVRYAWADNPAGANLYNKEGLPASPFTTEKNTQRDRISINDGWSFFKYESATKADKLIYDVRPEINDNTENKVADAKPTEAVEVEAKQEVLKPWILPSGNDFIKDPEKRHVRPEGNPGGDFLFVKNNFDDRSWEKVNLPHDWAIKGPFQKGWNSEVGGGMGRLPVNGVAWYRKKLDIPAADSGKSIFLDVDGAMSYAIVWLNGQLVGGWPYGYNSFRLDLTPFIKFGGENQLAIRIDNPNHSARWYPGAGLYRNVWLIKTNPIHVGQWGTYVTTKDISKESATINLAVSIDNKTNADATVEVSTSVYALDAKGNKIGKAVVRFSSLKSKVVSEESAKVEDSVTIKNPKLWGPPPTQTPNLYLAETTLSGNGKIIDTYETRFGIRSVEFNPDKGIFVNGEHIKIQGVNQHHDLGALGSAFNMRAAERQLEILREMGCNAIRMAHNPPAPELLELTDRMGFLVIDEIFDSWERKKTPHDFHLIFPDWSEVDSRAFIRRDRNCPSVIIWSFGNEVGEQYTDKDGADVAKRLYDFVKEEDPTRPTTLAMNFAKPDMPLPQVPDVIGLNYQGEGIRQALEFEGTDRIRTAPQYDAFHAKFPNKVIISTETASAFSSRGIYLFPVSKENSAPVRDGRGGDSKICQVSSYELHAVDFGSSADKVFGSLDRHPFVAGEFVWNGFDYIGEPTPYYEARSSYSGMIDLAGFKKDRFYLYQSRWRPELPMAHILPHWNWPERVGQITPVHVFSSGDEAELFLNGKSLGKKKKGEYEYRLRWDDVKYEPGELKVIAYKNGQKWAEEVVRTTGEASQLLATADRSQIIADGKDLAFITVKITDKDGLMVPRSNSRIEFSIEGPGEIVATDNGDSYNLESFASHQREAFNGLALVIVRAKPGEKGTITVKAKSSGLKETQVKVESK